MKSTGKTIMKQNTQAARITLVMRAAATQLIAAMSQSRAGETLAPEEQTCYETGKAAWKPRK